MHPRLSRITLLATALLVALPSFALANNTPVEGTTSKSYPEDYESFSTTGVNPTSPWGTYTTAGTGTYLVSTGGACTGTRCLAVVDTVTATFAVDFNNDGLGVNLCTAGQSVTFSFALSAGLTLNQVWHVRIATAGPVVVANPANSIDIALTGSLAATEAATIVLNSNTGVQTPVSLGSYTAPGVVGVTLDTMNCVGSTPSIHYTVLGGGLSATGTFTANSLVTGDFDSIQVASSSTALPSSTVALDNINWQGAPLPAPTVTAINPVRGLSSGGTPVTITGTGFKNAATTVAFGGTSVAATYVSGTTLTATTPAHSTGLVNVVVTNPDSQTGTLTNGYTYDPVPTPFIDALNPNHGRQEGGTLVNVTGGNFQSGFSATFDGFPGINPTFVSSSLVRVTSPPHGAATVNFILTNPGGASDSAPYVYDPAGPGGGAGGALDLTENFDDDTVGGFPSQSWYVFGKTGTSAVEVSNTYSDTPPNTLKIAAGATATYAVFNVAGADLCSQTNNQLNLFISLHVEALASGSNENKIFFYDASETHSVGIAWRTAANPSGAQIYVFKEGPSGRETGGTLTQLLTGPTSGFVDIAFSSNCDSPGPGLDREVSASFSGQPGLEGSSVITNGNSGFTGFTKLILQGVNNGFPFIDNVHITGAPVGGGSTCIFCAAKGNDNFGYDFVEGVELGTTNAQCRSDTGFGVAESDAQIDVVPCLKFEGDDTNFDYLAKSWTNGQKHVASYFKIEAANEGHASVFRDSFSTVAGVPNNAAKGTGSCQGKCNGQFAEHVEVRFLESGAGNDWNVQIYHVSASNGVTVRTALGPAFTGGNSNSPTLYEFSVDTSLASPKAYVREMTLESVDCSKPGAIDQGNGECTTGNLEGSDLFPGGITLPSYWAGDLFLNQWFIGYGTDVNFDAATRLEPGESANGDFSTCIYAIDGTTAPVTNGDQGRVPPPDSDGDGVPDGLDSDDDNDGTPDLTDTTPGTAQGVGGGPAPDSAGGSFFLPDDAVLPDGFTRSSFAFLLGILFMFFLAAGTYFTLGKSATAGAIGGGAGFLGAFAFGLFPLWAVLLVALACAAILVLRFRGGGG